MPMSEADLIVWSALFARTNYGQEMPSAHAISLYRIAAKERANLTNMVNMVCASFVETDDDFSMFFEEAASWYASLKDQELDYIWKHWPHKKAVWEESGTK
jgi:hypothetical protein